MDPITIIILSLFLLVMIIAAAWIFRLTWLGWFTAKEKGFSEEEEFFAREAPLPQRAAQLAARERAITVREAVLAAREAAIDRRIKEFEARHKEICKHLIRSAKEGGRDPEWIRAAIRQHFPNILCDEEINECLFGPKCFII